MVETVRGLLISLLLFTSIPNIAGANEPLMNVTSITGEALLEWCTGDSIDEMVCLSYISGVRDGIAVSQMKNFINGNANSICAPADLSNQYLSSVVVRYIINNTALRNVKASILVAGAMAQAWPCES